MSYRGSCHCGRLSYEVDGEIAEAIECNCSHCSRKGYLLWFVPRDALKVHGEPSELATYLFNKHMIRHHFCTNCGCAPFGEGKGPGGEMAAINVRCLEGVDPHALRIRQVDGRSF